jgi:heme O synthase-like polyprenyltransferase
LYFRIFIVVVTVASLFINVQVYFAGLLGMLDNLITNSKWFKRKNLSKLILGGLAGRISLLFG